MRLKSVADSFVVVDDVDQSGRRIFCRQVLHKVNARREMAKTPEGLDLCIGSGHTLSSPPQKPSPEPMSLCLLLPPTVHAVGSRNSDEDQSARASNLVRGGKDIDGLFKSAKLVTSLVFKSVSAKPFGESLGKKGTNPKLLR